MNEEKRYIDLQYFADANTNTTTGLSAEMKTFYDKELLRHARPKLVHDQFAQKRPIPKNGGKEIEFRQFGAIPESDAILTEGVTPNGVSLSVSTLTSTVSQYGKYATLSDVLELTAIDNIIAEATEMMGINAGNILDSVTRSVLNTGTNVFYGGNKTSRNDLEETDVLTADLVLKAAACLEIQDTPTFEDGCYVCIINPLVAYDLIHDERWMTADKYAGSTKLFNGELGRLGGVRFVKASRAKVWSEATSTGLNVFSTLIFGKNAFGVTEIEGGGLQIIVKPKGSGGTSDPLDQRSTVGWKGIKTAEILNQRYLIRIETTSTINDGGIDTKFYDDMS